MKFSFVLFISWFLAAFTYKAMAQDNPRTSERREEKTIIIKGDKEEGDGKTEEIVIRKKGDKDVNLSIQITKDKVMINGKPLIEFNDDNVVIHKKQVMIRNKNQQFQFPGQPGQEFNFNFDNGSDVMLGVSSDKAEKGVIIKEVTAGSGAAAAGLQEGDIILKLDKANINSPQQLFDEVNKKEPGDEVKVTYNRNGKEKTVKARLQERKEKTLSMTAPGGMYRSFSMPDKEMEMNQHYIEKMASEMAMQSLTQAGGFGRPRLGLEIQDTEDESGVKVLNVEADSYPAKAGIAKGDIITEIAGKKVVNTDQAREALADVAGKSLYNVKANRNGSSMSFDLKVPKKLKTAKL